MDKECVQLPASEQNRAQNGVQDHPEAGAAIYSTAGLTERQLVWLTAYKGCLSITTACQRTGIGRTTVYDWIRKQPPFARAKEEVRTMLVEDLEAFRRAFAGPKDPHSARILMTLLKAGNPEKYGTGRRKVPCQDYLPRTIILLEDPEHQQDDPQSQEKKSPRLRPI